MKKAFTLIEILIVVILLGILAAVVVPQFVDQTATTRDAAAVQTQAVINSAWQQYVATQLAAGTRVAVPTDDGVAIQALVTGGYLNEVPDSTQFTIGNNGGASAQAYQFTVTAINN